MASSSQHHHRHHPIPHKKTTTTAPTRLPQPPMATITTRKGPEGEGGRGGEGDPAADHRAKDRRRPSPTMVGPAKTASRPSSAAEKSAGHKSTPSYLRPTASSRVDPAAKKPTTTAAAPSAKKLTRVRSMERHPPSAPAPAPTQQRRVQPSRSLKETTAAKPAATTARTALARTAKASPQAAARPVGPKARSLPSKLKNKKKEAASSAAASASASASPRCVVLPHDHLDVLETRSEPDVVNPTAKLTLEDEDLVHEHVDHAAPDQPTMTTTTTDVEKPQEQVEPRRHIEEYVVHASGQEQQQQEEEEHKKKQQQEEPKVVVEEIWKEADSSSLGRLKSSSHHQVQVSRSSGADDELQRKLMRRQAWEVDKNVGSSVLEEKVEAAKEETNKANAAAVKKEGSSGNDVIEEATSKLIVEKRKNKVLALVGAFESVMSLQEQPETPSHVRAAETPSHAKAPVGQSAFEREMQKQEEEEKEKEKEEIKEAPRIAQSAEVSNDVRSKDGVVAVVKSGGENATEEGAQTKAAEEADQKEKKGEEKGTEEQ